MTGTQARDFIQTLRRQVLAADALRLSLLALITAGIIATPFYAVDPRLQLLWLLSAAAGVAWISLTMLSLRQMRSANQASSYMASGRLDLAENQLMSAAHQFSLYRQGKLLACHNLAVVAHGRRNYEAAASLCDGVLAMRTNPRQMIGRTSRILLADCRLSMGDISAAARALAPLSLTDEQLSLDEQLLLLTISTRAKVAAGEYEAAVSELTWKIRRAELLDAPRAAMVHALLSLACRMTNQPRMADFLLKRSRLYHDLTELADEVPGLQDLLSKATSADNI